MQTENNIGSKISWIGQSVTIKVLVIVFLSLFLLIPSEMIRNLIREREGLSEMAKIEVSSKWANQQTLTGPVLTIPFTYMTKNDDGTLNTYTDHWQILPEELSINGVVTPELLSRGIYDVAVYTSDLDVQGNFHIEEPLSYPGLAEIQYENAFLTIGISDMRGIKDEVAMDWGGTTLSVKPGTRIPNVINSGITVDLPDGSVPEEGVQPFHFSLHLRGSQNLSFVPAGGTTQVKISSPWPSPSFGGNFLPDEREVNTDGFSAEWKVLQLNRNFPQSWTSTSGQIDMRQSAFGVDLLLSLDDYQKSERSIKYAIMTIALTFLVFFLVEILNKRRIHPLQYALVGLGLVLFYALLISISEHSNFNIAYAISFAAIFLMITLYSIRVFKSGKLTFLLACCLAGIYAFVFVILQMEDYALLMGSAGLLIILSMTMYFTRNIDWYRMRIADSDEETV